MPKLRVKKLRKRYTHQELVELAGVWLGGGVRKCGLVMLEANCYAIREFPDAIGWRVNGYSILVECKVSLTDFNRDRHKPAKRSAQRNGKETMGRERYYLAPPGLLTADDMPEGYGLLQPGMDRLVVIKRADTDERPGRQAAEAPLLINRARRQGWDFARQDTRHVRMRHRSRHERKPAGCVVYEGGDGGDA